MNGVVLAIFDGLGLAFPGPGNAFFLAEPPTFKSLSSLYPHTQLAASGEAVGLPKNEAGNTEVGHLNIAAGRILYQSLPRIDLSIADGSFYDNKVFLEAAEHAKKHDSGVHLIGLLGEGSVHASTAHLYALLYLLREQHIKKVFIHVIGDGRDSPPQAIKEYLVDLESKIKELQTGTIASVMGRFYGMDRDNRWDRIEKAYECLTEGTARKVSSWRDSVDQSYGKQITDEFIEPTIIVDDKNEPLGLIKDNDTIIFYNFRIDRPRELTKAFTLEPPFQRKKVLKNLFFVTMTEYDHSLPVHVAFPPQKVNQTLGEIVASRSFRQLRLAESEKERFVTIYFNGLHDEPFPLEDRIIVPSPQIDTYDKKPEMSAPEVTNKLIDAVNSEQYKFIAVNFANADMVGHTGNLEAGMKAIIALDGCLQKIIEATLAHNYALIVTGDHGNIEEMRDPITNNVSTEHSTNPVPFVIIDPRVKNKPLQLSPGILADVAPTVLYLLGIPKPIDMTGRNLVEDVSELQFS